MHWHCPSCSIVVSVKADIEFHIIICCYCFHDKSIRQCLYGGRQMPQSDEEFNQIHVVLEYIFDVNVDTEMVPPFHCPLLA